MKFHVNHFLTVCYVFQSKYGDLKFPKKIRSINESKQTLTSPILTFRGEVVERSIMAQIEGLDINFQIQMRVFILWMLN